MDVFALKEITVQKSLLLMQRRKPDEADLISHAIWAIKSYRGSAGAAQMRVSHLHVFSVSREVESEKLLCGSCYSRWVLKDGRGCWRMEMVGG